MNATWLSILASLLKFAIWLVQFLERQKLKAEGRAEANEAANAEQKERIALGQAARDDHDDLADGSVRDPRQRD